MNNRPAKGVVMMKRTYNEKLKNTQGLPKVQFIGLDDKMAKRYGCGHMLIAAPYEYDEIMKRIPEGYVITSEEIRTYLAQKHNADYTCQLTAGIFINIAAHASQEREISGSNDLTPYWRTLKKGGELNEKYPGGIDQQKFLLEAEGHGILKKGKRYYVKDYQKVLYQL